MKHLFLIIAMMLWFAAPVYADRYSNESEETPNDGEEGSKDDAF